MKKPAALLGAAALLLLSSCNFIQPDVESLMQPPKLTAEQRQLGDALAAAIGTRDYLLKYPMTGEYRSAFVFHDLDGDGVQEAIVFYQPGQEDTTPRLKVLAQQDGEWESLFDVAGSGTDVRSVQFAPMLVPEISDIIVTWSEPGRQQFQAVVYSLDEGRLEPLFSSEGDYMYMVDSNEDALYELLLLNRGTQRNPSIQLARRRGTRRVLTSSKVMLNPQVTEFKNVTVGNITTGKPAVFIDAMIGSDTMGTEVVLLESVRLQNLMEGESEELFLSTLRPQEIYSQDIDGDGTVEIPLQLPLSGYSDSREEEPIYLTTYYNMARNSITPTSYTSIVNTEMGFKLDIPPKWQDRITVKRSALVGEWRIYVFDSTLDNSTTELARIRVTSHRDYQDKFEQEEYFTLATKGIFEYKGRVLSPGNALSITAEELKAMFKLI